MDPLLDALDVRLLAALQAEGRASHVRLSEVVPLSPSQVQRRLRRLEEEGLIAGYVALLDAERLGLGVTAFTHVGLERHGERPAAAFHEAVRRMEAVQECWSVSGEADYLLRIVAPDLRAFSDFLMHRLLPVPGVASVKSNIVLERVKTTTALPLGHLAEIGRGRGKVRSSST